MKELTVDDVTETGRTLHLYATHFSLHDWDYTRDVGDLTHIRYRRDTTGYNHPVRRAARTARTLARQWTRPTRMDGMLRLGRGSLKGDTRWERAKDAAAQVRATMTVGLRTDDNLPDGVLDNGNVITFWEETGEYIQMVQPSVGELVAQFLIEHPDHPHARMIAAEIARIQGRYTERLNDAGNAGTWHLDGTL